MASSVRPSRAVFQLPNNCSWFENLAVTAGGTILATRLDIPEVWEIDPATGKGETFITFPAPHNGVTGIAELKDGLFAIGVGQYDVAKGPVPGSWEVWTVDLSTVNDGNKPQPQRVVALPDIGLLNGVAAWDASRVLVADSNPGKIYLVDVASGTFSVPLDDELLGLPADPFLPFGVNGIKASTDQAGGKYVYFTNSARLLLGRVPLDGDANPRGKAEVLAKGFTGDDLALAADGASVLVATHGMNTVVRIEVGGEAVGEGNREVVTVAGDKGTLEIAGGTACAFGRRAEDKGTLYVVTTGGLSMPVNGHLVEAAKVVAVDLA